MLQLEYLNLGGNFFEGEVPPELSSLKTLSVLYLFKNSLKGSIPKELGKMKSLQKLSLADNRLSGEIPKELGDLKMKKDFGSIDFSNNLLSGQIPNSICSLIENNIDISLAGNSICGPYPDCILESIGFQDTIDCLEE